MNAYPEIEPMTTRVAFHPFLAGMHHAQVALLADCAMAIRFEPGQLIFREGGFAQRFYLVETGKVILETNEDTGERIIVDKAGPGDLLGWSWMFPPYIWHFSARAAERTEAIFFNSAILREYCERDQALGYDLMKRMSAVMVKRLAAAQAKMRALELRRRQMRAVAEAR